VGGGWGGRDEGRSFFCFWYLTFVSLLFFLVFYGLVKVVWMKH